MAVWRAVSIAITFVVVGAGCGDDGSNGSTQDVDASSDADVSIAHDAEAGADAKGDTVHETGAEAGAETGTEAGAETGTGADADADAVVDAGEGGCPSYATNFDGTESPISEGGAWTHVGLDWALVDTAGGIAFGTQTGTGGYDDSYAHLSGFCADQTASAVIHRDATMDGSCTHEVEIHLRWSDAAHDAHGYECNLAYDGSYAQIVRWNGAFGSFDYLGSGSVPGGVKDGDVISASAIGSTITLSVNGVVVATATDATWPTGNPGMGFWRGGPCGTRGDYGFTSYTASSTP